MSLPILDIFSTVNSLEGGSFLSFDEEFLGERNFNSLKAHFSQEIYSVHTIKELNKQEAADFTVVSFNGLFQSFLNKKDVSVAFFFVEINNEINLLFESSLTDRLFFEFLEIISPQKTEDFKREELLELYLNELSLGENSKLFFSTFDNSTNDISFKKVYPAAWESILPAKSLRRGINIGVTGAFIEGIDSFIQGIQGITYFVLDNTLPQPKGLIYHEDTGLRFRYLYPVSSELTIPAIEKISLEFNELGLDFPIEYTGEFYPQMYWEGHLNIGSSPVSGAEDERLKLGLGANFDFYHKILALECRDSPGLLDFLTKAGINDFKDLLIDPFKSILNVNLSLLKLVFDLKSPAITEINLALSCDPIVIIKDLIEFQPEFTLDISYPFNSNYRDIEGAFIGHWEVGSTQLETAITFPHYQFYAGLPEETQLTIAPSTLIGNTPLDDILPTSLNITQLAVSGNLRQRAFTFELAVEAEWQIVDGLSFEKFELMVGMSQAEGGSWDKTFYVGAELEIEQVNGGDTVHIELSANYQTGSGFHFRGSTGAGEELEVGKMIDALATKMNAGQMDLPEAVRSLSMRNLLVEFDTQGNFTFSVLTSLEVEGRALDFYVNLQKKSGSVSSSDWEVVGSLYVDIGMELTVAFSSDKSKTIIGALSFDPTLRYSSAQLLARIAPDKAAAVPFNVSVGLQGLLLAANLDSTQKNYLFRILFDLEVSLEGLPLIGSMLKEVKFTEGQLLATQAAWPQEAVSNVNTLLGKFPTPPPQLEAPRSTDPQQTGLPAGFALGATFQISEDLKFPLYLQLASGRKKMEPEPANGDGDGGTVMQLTEESPDPAPEPTPETLPDQRSRSKVSQLLGAVRIRQVGLVYEKGRMGLKITGGLALAAFEFELTGLQVSVPQEALSDPAKLTEIEFGLDGFAADIQKGPMVMRGAFLRSKYTDKTGTYDAYNGLVQLSFPPFSLAGMGSYMDYNGSTSLFAFVALGFPIPVSSALLIQGLSAGFGLHRDFVEPELKDVLSFPLIAMSVTPPPEVPIGQLVESMNRYFPPLKGQYFVVAGIKFRAFGLIDNLAMLAVEFGEKELAIHMMGVSSVLLPGAFIELVWQAKLQPTKGDYLFRGELSHRSFLLLPMVELRGGFAAQFWTSGDHAGDFVLSVGGYHPDFAVPAHYPQQIPRLGVNFSMDPLLVKGGVYFALTPTCLMLGASLQASLEVREDFLQLKAYLDIQFHALLNFQPVHYDVHAQMQMGMELTLGVGKLSETFDIHLHADIHLWGPNFAGLAKIEVKGKEFQVKFGDQQKKPLMPLSWTKFQEAFLGGPKDVCALSVTRGVLQEVKEGEEGNEKITYLVDADELEITIKSLVPLAEAPDLVDSEGTQPIINSFGIAPMDIESQTGAQLKVTFNKTGSKDHFQIHALNDRLQKSIWGTGGLEGAQALGAAQGPPTIESFTGVRIVPKKQESPKQTAEIEEANFRSNPDTAKVEGDPAIAKFSTLDEAVETFNLPSEFYDTFTGLSKDSVLTKIDRTVLLDSPTGIKLSA